MYGISTRSVKDADIKGFGLIIGEPENRLMLRPGDKVQALSSVRGALTNYIWSGGHHNGRGVCTVSHVFSDRQIASSIVRERYVVPCSAWFIVKSDKLYAVYPLKRQTLYLGAVRKGRSLTMMVIPAEGKLQGLGDEMPLAMGSGAAAKWLSTGEWSRDEIIERMRPFRAELLDFYCARGSALEISVAEEKLTYLLAPRGPSFVENVNMMMKEDEEKRREEISQDQRMIKRDPKARWKQLMGDYVR